MRQPLLIGGATTSRTHTAVKIQPEYAGGVVHVLDASRSVPVAQTLLGDGKTDFLGAVSTEYEKLREDFARKRGVKEYVSYEEAAKNRVAIDWSGFQPARPTFLGTKEFPEYSLAELVPYIDWTPFFTTWELRGKYPDILVHEEVGQEATKLFHDAKALLDTIVGDGWLQAKGVVGFWSAAATGPDTVTLFEEYGTEKTRLEFLRQQVKKAPGQPHFSLADFIRPQSEIRNPKSEINDYIGAFAVSIHGIEPHLERFAAAHDDYQKIMLQALADRLAEAFAERLHERVRKEFWGYAADEALGNEDLVREKYQGIRPAPGYPACPDHTEKRKLFSLLNASEAAGIQLTESLAMYPAASVCGWYFSHPQSTYFGVGKIGEDQFVDYAARKGGDADDLRRWLSPILEA